MLYKIFYTALQLTWGVLQNIVGAIIFLLFIKNKHYFWNGSIVTVWNSKTASLGIGMFIFIRKPQQGEAPDNFTGRTDFDRTLVHEYGHTVQSIILGPLFLPIIALPSLLWCGLPFFIRYRKEKLVSYYSFYPEKWANYLGEKITKNEAVWGDNIKFSEQQKLSEQHANEIFAAMLSEGEENLCPVSCGFNTKNFFAGDDMFLGYATCTSRDRLLLIKYSISATGAFNGSQTEAYDISLIRKIEIREESLRKCIIKAELPTEKGYKKIRIETASNTFAKGFPNQEENLEKMLEILRKHEN